MWRTLLTAATGWAALTCCGCFATEPLLQNPTFFRVEQCAVVEDPVFLPQGPQSYGALFEMVLDVMSDYFDIKSANRYDGRILTFARIAPGLEQPFKPGSPDFEDRLYATLQTLRQYAEVTIQPVDEGGFLVNVIVHRDLEDLPQPTRAMSSAAIFRGEVSVERQQQEVIELTYLGSHWIPRGRDTQLEQVILQRISRWDRRPKTPQP